MEAIFIITGILSFLTIIIIMIGMLKPSIVIRWGNNRGRKEVFSYYVPLMILLIVISVVSEPDSVKENYVQDRQARTEAQQEEQQKADEAKKQNRIQKFADNYHSIYSVLKADSDTINKGYASVKKQDKYLVDYHTDLQAVKENLKQQKEKLEKLNHPKGLDYKTFEALSAVIDNYDMAIDAFEGASDVMNPALMDKFEEDTKRGDTLLKLANEKIEKWLSEQ